MIRRMFVLAGLALLVFAPAAHAQYGTPGLSVSDSSVSSGDTITVTATGCEPGSTVSFLIDGTPLGAAVADDSGTAAASVDIVAADGTHVISNSCNDAVISITVGGAVAGPGALPRTGSDNSLPLAKVAIVLIAAGGMLLVVTRNHAKTKQTVNA